VAPLPVNNEPLCKSSDGAVKKAPTIAVPIQSELTITWLNSPFVGEKIVMLNGRSWKKGKKGNLAVPATRPYSH